MQENMLRKLALTTKGQMVPRVIKLVMATIRN